MKMSFYSSASCVIPEGGLSMFTAQLSYLLQLYMLSPSLYRMNTMFTMNTQPRVFVSLSIITRASALFTVSSGRC